MTRRSRPEGFKLEPTYLRPWRQYRGKTLAQVGAAIKLDTVALSRIEVGKTPYDQIHLQQLADEYKVTIQDLLYRDPFRPKYADQVADKVRKITSPVDLRAIETLAEALLSPTRGGSR